MWKYLHAITIRWWRIIASQWRSETSTRTQVIINEANEDMEGNTSDRIRTCRRCKLAKVKCNKCPNDCKHCLGSVCTRCCKHIQRGDPHIFCVHDRKKPLGRPLGSKNIVPPVPVPVLDLEETETQINKWTQAIARMRLRNLHAIGARTDRNTNNNSECRQVGADNNGESRHGYGLRAKKKHVVYNDNASTHDMAAGIDTKEGGHIDNESEEPTNVPTGNTNQDPKIAAVKIDLITPGCKLIEYEPTFYVGMTSALTQVKRKMSPLLVETVTELGWTETGKDPEAVLDDLARLLVMNRKTLLQRYNVHKNRKEGQSGMKIRARNRNNRLKLSTTGGEDELKEPAMSLLKPPPANSLMGEEDELKEPAISLLKPPPANSLMGEEDVLKEPAISLLKPPPANSLKGIDDELKEPAISYYMTDEEALIQLENKMGYGLTRVLTALGWKEDDRTDEKALDDIAKLLRMNKERMLRKYRIVLQPSYCHTMEECLAAVKTKIGKDKMNYWTTQGWTESYSPAKGVTDLAGLMDITATHLLKKYRIYQARTSKQDVGNQGKTTLEAKLVNNNLGSKYTNSETTKKRKASMVTKVNGIPLRKKKNRDGESESSYNTDWTPSSGSETE